LNSRRRLRLSLFNFLAFIAITCLFTSCSSKPQQPQAAAEAPKRYHLAGKVISIDKSQKFAQIDGQDIPGFMAAMTMNYPVLDVSQLDKIGPGDEIAADVVVTSDGYHLENIVVTKKGNGVAPPTSQLHIPQPGDEVPNFALLDQDSKRIHLSAYKGSVLLITFIYTRCPFASYCPLVSKNFAHIYANARGNPALSSKMRLLSVSFDPANDTPAVLRQYAATFQAVTQGAPFARWEFASVPPKELKQMTDFFGVTYQDNGGNITHSMSTSVISPDGRIYKWYDDNSWQPADLMKDATEALLQNDATSTATQARLRIPSSSAQQAN